MGESLDGMKSEKGTAFIFEFCSWNICDLDKLTYKDAHSSCREKKTPAPT